MPIINLIFNNNKEILSLEVDDLDLLRVNDLIALSQMRAKTLYGRNVNVSIPDFDNLSYGLPLDQAFRKMFESVGIVFDFHEIDLGIKCQI